MAKGYEIRNPGNQEEMKRQGKARRSGESNAVAPSLLVQNLRVLCFSVFQNQQPPDE
jgi:hypothetical protein